MSVNKNKKHLVVFFEDRANMQLWNGFLTNLFVNINQIKSLGISGGRDKALKNIENFEMARYPMRYVLLIWDYDNNYDSRYKDFQEAVKALNLSDKCFVLGSKNEPEELRKKLNLSLDKIGEKLADECVTKNYCLWEHEQLRHNKPELERLNLYVCDFLIEN